MDAAVEVNEADASALQRPFLATLVRLLRAEDTYGAWEGKSDEQLLRPFVVTKEERRARCCGGSTSSTSRSVFASNSGPAS